MSNGKSSSEPKLTLMSIAAIVVNFAMQSRVNMDLDHVRRITEAILDGATFKNAPVDVFEIEPGVYWLVEGFHRTEGHKKAGKTAIWARVHQGTKSDAVAFAASANLRYDALTVTKADKEKAARMLLEDQSLSNNADGALATLCGLSRSKVGQLRRSMCMAAGISPPSVVQSRNGRLVPYERSKPGEHRIFKKKQSRGNAYSYRCKFNGKHVHLGATEEAARAKLAELVGDQREKRVRLIVAGNLSQWLGRRRVISRGKVATLNSSGAFPGLIFPGAIARIESRISPRSAAQAVGDLFFWREEVGDPSLRLILICYPDGDDMQALIEPARNFGVEILTPEQVVEQFAGKKFPDESESA